MAAPSLSGTRTGELRRQALEQPAPFEQGLAGDRVVCVGDL